MKRSEIARKTPMRPGKGFKPAASTLKRSGKLSPRSKTNARRDNPAIRQSAKMQDCTIILPGVCNRDPATVVWCHENSYAAGKGMGLKAHDEHGAYGCSCCHAVYDGQNPRPDWLTKEQVDSCFAKGKEKSRDILKVKGLI